jgi:chorismate--pyruvate lyase
MRSRHFHDPLWRGARSVPTLVPDPALRTWLTDDSSLSRRLQARCGAGRFNVEIISERLARPSRDEAAMLGLPQGRFARVRLVWLRCGATRWVYARTVIPMETLRGPNAGLTRLGSRPLGHFLFAHPQTRRGPLQITRTVLPGEGPVFGRRSLFFLHGRPLLVSEFFLDAFVRGLDGG